MKAKIHYSRIPCRDGEQTVNPAMVTCRRCIARLHRLAAIPGPILYREGVPVFAARAEGRFRKYYHETIDNPAERGCYLVFTCPLCGARLAHGGVYGRLGAGDGHRCAHCNCWPNGYYIKEV